MAVKFIMLSFILVIFYCLGSGVYYLIRVDSAPAQLAKALTWRIALSLGLFSLLFIAYALGWLTPNWVYVMPPGLQ